MSVANSEAHLSTVRNLTHPYGINPVIYLEEVRQQSRTNKLLTLKQSLTSISSNTDKQDHHTNKILNIFETLKIKNTLLSSDIDNSTKIGKEIITIITDLLLHVVHQIGQTNVRTPTLESILAYIRSLIHTRSAHMRQTIPGPLLISWYDISNLMSSLQNEPELRITTKKAKQLINIAHDTTAWAHKHLSAERINDEHIGFVDRSSIPYTYE